MIPSVFRIASAATTPSSPIPQVNLGFLIADFGFAVNQTYPRPVLVHFKKLERASGIEPEIDGFAGRRFIRLAMPANWQGRRDSNPLRRA